MAPAIVLGRLFTKDELKPGAHVLVVRPEKAPDGSLQTARINVGIGNMVP